MDDQQWAFLAVDACLARGVDHFFIAPGSRCTPLTLAVASFSKQEHSQVRVIQHFDERGLAFAAAAFGRAAGHPAVFICTSGTAVANALPATIEAAAENLPLLLFTADRPPELRDTGANQTIDQSRLFGNYARWFFDMPCPDAAINPQFVVSQVDEAIRRSHDGPVHLNWMFREPFQIDDRSPREVLSAERSVAHSAPRSRLEAETQVTYQPPIGTKSQVFARPISVTARRPLIALGGSDEATAQATQRLATQSDVPFLADITSGLSSAKFTACEFALPAPDLVLQVGGRIVSKAWTRWLERHRPRVLHLSALPQRHNAAHLEYENVVSDLSRLDESIEFSAPLDADFRAAWQTLIANTNSAVTEALAPEARLAEPTLAFSVSQRLDPQHSLFLGNSTPIRDFDRYAVWLKPPFRRVAANRGASGIDGLIASAVGNAVGSGCPTTAVLGDLSTLHDLNSLALLRRPGTPPVTLIVLNNQGGGIFDLLPISQQTAHFEQYFITPHRFSFEHVAAMFGLPYASPASLDEFAEIYRRHIDSTEPSLIEVQTDRVVNQQIRVAVNKLVAETQAAERFS